MSSYEYSQVSANFTQSHWGATKPHDGIVRGLVPQSSDTIPIVSKEPVGVGKEGEEQIIGGGWNPPEMKDIPSNKSGFGFDA